MRFYLSSCGYCIIPYDFIASVDTLDRDMAYAMNVINITHYDYDNRDKNSISSYPRHFNPSTGISAKDFFRTLTKPQKDGLYRIFRLDFMAFGYSPEEYMWI